MQKSKYYDLIRNDRAYVAKIKDVKIPLYRYRSFNEYSLSDLVQNEMSFTTPSEFNDPYDSSVICDKEVIRNELNKYLKGTNLLLDNIISVDSIVSFLKVDLKKIYGVACFSETITNETMWAHYADCGKGFALEYELHEIEDRCKKHEKDFREQIFKDSLSIDLIPSFPHVGPVLYDNKKYNINSILKNLFEYAKDTLGQDQQELVIKYMLYNEEEVQTTNQTITYLKNKNWSYEKEWRAVCINPKFPQEKHFSVSGIKAKAIYLGEFISDKLEKILRKIALDKGLSVFKMKSISLKDKIKLKVTK